MQARVWNHCKLVCLKIYYDFKKKMVAGVDVVAVVIVVTGVAVGVGGSGGIVVFDVLTTLLPFNLSFLGWLLLVL